VIVGFPAITAAGGVLIAWQHGTATHLARVAAGQVSEVGLVRDPLSRKLTVPDVVTGAGGHGLVTWEIPDSRTDGRKRVIRAAFLRPDLGLGPARSIAAIDSVYGDIAAVGADGTGAVAWLDTDHTGLSRARIRVLRADGSWGPVTSVSRPAREDFDPPFPAIAGAPGGHVLAAFAEPSRRGEDFGDRRLVLARATTP
jgi:hypothetical protein